MSEEKKSVATPELQAILEAVTKAVQASQLTPELINELKKPFIDPIEEHQKQETRIHMRQLQTEAIETKRNTQANCPHRRGNVNKVFPVTNFPDGQARGICLLCQDVMHPDHYEWDHETKGYVLVPAHPQYHRVVEAMNSLIEANG